MSEKRIVLESLKLVHWPTRKWIPIYNVGPVVSNQQNNYNPVGNPRILEESS